MRPLLTSLSILFLGLSMLAQPYGNEWIDYEQTYYSFKIVEDGLYRIDRSALQAVGVPVENLDPRGLQVFGREQEQAIHVVGESDGSFDQEDYIEFFARGNDGEMDRQMYVDPEGQPDREHSLINDTITYYLSWVDTPTGLRIASLEENDFNAYDSPPYLWVRTKHRYEPYPNDNGVLVGVDYTYGDRVAFNPDVRYVDGEGWYSSRFGNGNGSPNRSVDLPVGNVHTGGPAAQGETVTASATNASSTDPEFNHHLRIFRGENEDVPIADLLFSGYEMHRSTFSVSAGQIGEDNFHLSYQVVDDLGAATDGHRISFASLTYPHTMDVSDLPTIGFSMGPNPDITQDRYHLQLQEVDLADPVLYTTSGEGYRIKGFPSAAGINFLVPDQPFGEPSDCYVTDASEPLSVIDLQAVHGSGNFIDYRSAHLDSAFIIITHPLLMASAEEYASYRSSPTAGRDALAVDVEQLYGQYGGGVSKHPLAIRRFVDELMDEWESDPAQLFFLGKSVYTDMADNKVGTRFDSLSYAQSLVPSFGAPASDDLFTAGLNSTSAMPSVPVGRISALTSTEADDYLSKVIAHENAEPALWMKNVLHFGGGANESEQGVFQGYLENYASIIADTCFGADVSTFLKTSSLPIEVNESELISDLIAEGTSMFTFFGHAGGTGFDVSLDDPTNLDWGAFPFILVNSCYTGDIHQRGHPSTSEDYVILPDKGAIGFLAHTRQGLPGLLNPFSTEMHRQIASSNYNKPLGTQIVAAKEERMATNPGNIALLNSLYYMTLEGDPAIRIHGHDKPDMRITEQSVFFSPEEVTTVLDSFYMHVVVDNVGKAIAESFQVEVVRSLPGGGEEIRQRQLQGSLTRDTVTFAFAVDFASSFGINNFDISVDVPVNAVDETIDYANNIVQDITLSISDGGVYPVLPAAYAVVPSAEVILKASTGNPFAVEKTYRMELDTTDLFDSPLLLGTEIIQTGGVLEWPIPLSLVDSTVYFWRVAELREDIQWRESSFQYIPDRSGWGQAHFFQFEEDDFNTLTYDRPQREFAFLTGEKTLSAKVFGNSTDFVTGLSSEYFIDFDSQDYAGCESIPAFHVVVVDPVTLEPWRTEYTETDGTVLNPGNSFGNANANGACRNRPEGYFIFRQNNTAQMVAMMDMIENHVPAGHYLMIYSWRYMQPGILSEDVLSFLSQEGLTEIASLDSADNLPFIAIGVAGDPSSFQETIGEEINSVIEASYDMTVTGNQGRIVSEIAGPATAWESLSWRSSPLDEGIDDQLSISLIGVTASGAEVDLQNAVFEATSQDIVDLDTYVDAVQYPFLRLKARIKDTTQVSALQLDRWHLLYAPVPEAALDPALAFSFDSPEVQEGEELRLISTIRNISEVDMDSLLVDYWVRDRNNVRHEIPYDRQAPLLAGGSLIDTVTFNTVGFSGVNSLWVEANPYVEALEDYDQVEQHHFNNLGQLKFVVHGDEQNPILDVTFDGIHILDGEIVSTQPEILIRLDDENRFLLMDEPTDTAFFDIFLRQPNGTRLPVYFQSGSGEELLTFIPASGAENVAQIHYRPDLIQDGVYELIVIAADKSGNQSGDIDYRIRFEVDSEASITEVLNYPNPFSTSTRFVFTLTGAEVPDYIRIQIMTVSGRVIREIFKEELGPLRIGRNVTEYAWDGRDEFGDPLGNGVYLYRVTAKDNGEGLKERQTSASQFFKKGFGKMYLMR